MWSNKEIGRFGEDKACEFLAHKGYRIIDRNFSCKKGEIDIVVISKKNELVFVEVKTRRTKNFGMPCESVTYNKIKHIVACSKFYIYLYNFYDLPVRYDVVEVFLYNSSFLVNHIINAF